MVQRPAHQLLVSQANAKADVAVPEPLSIRPPRIRGQGRLGLQTATPVRVLYWPDTRPVPLNTPSSVNRSVNPCTTDSGHGGSAAAYFRPGHVGSDGPSCSCDPLDLDRVEAERLHARQHASQR